MKALKHLKTILRHKFWVGYFCFKCGLYWQGITHDLSKFSPTEFIESVKYYDGTRSPIDVCKEKNKYSSAWLHHKGRNKHHYEHWTDNYDKGTEAIKMPWRYALEMICDYLGAGVAYGGGIKNFSMEKELEWWENKKKTAKMNEDTKWLVDTIFDRFSTFGIKEVLKNKKYLSIIRDEYRERS